MGNHGGASARLRASEETERAKTSTDFHLLSSQAFTLRNWPVSWRLFAVIMLTLAMGLVFGGLRVAGAADSAAQFSRVSQLANLGQQITVLTQALANERDKTCGSIGNSRTMLPLYSATDAAAARVRTLAAGVGGSFPADIQAKVTTVRSEIASLGQLRNTAQSCSSALIVISDYAVPINDMMALNAQIGQGANDPPLGNDVQTLNSLSQEKDQVSQQRAILYDAFNKGAFANAEQEALVTAVAGQSAAATAFDATATPAEQDAFTRVVSGDLVKQAVNIENYVLSTNRLDVGNAAAVGVSTKNAPGQWYKSMSDTIDRMQKVELGVAGNIVARAQVLQRGAERSALFIAILTAAILILVLLATFVVARSLVQPLRRLREGALDIATVQLPERVRRLDESREPDPSLAVEPIDVLSVDEIGQVARAFDQVHAEAVRLAGNEALLRRSFNAMFVSLSRRSQSLIERLVRMIDSLEQNEEDPGRLANLFSMDHLVTRMRRNSENLLLLAGHEGARKWSEPVPLTDVTRAAISEIEQYNRVALKIQPGVMVAGHAVSDVVHLLAELIENATVFSASDSRVLVSVQELASGGVLIQVSDSGVGVSDTRLAEMNRRLDDPPPIDESISRHMGLYAVARLAERHGIRVRLRAGNPQGLTALVWLPDSVAERGGRQYGDVPQRLAAFEARRAPGQHATGTGPAGVPSFSGPPAVPSFAGPAALGPSAATGPATEPWGTHARPETSPQVTRTPTGPNRVLQPAGPASTAWFQNRQPAATDAAGAPSRPEAHAQPAEAHAQPAEAYSRPAEAFPPTENAWPAAADSWAAGRQAAQIVANPVRGDRTVAGMPVRVPHANLLPGSADGGQRPASQNTASQNTGNQNTGNQNMAGQPGGGYESPASSGLPQRSPETARSRLSGFQRGARRAEDQASNAEMRTDR